MKSTWGKTLEQHPKFILLIFLLAFPQRDLRPSTRVTVLWRKAINQNFWWFLDTVPELTLLPGDPKHHCGPPIGVRTYGSQAINEVSAHIPNPFCVYFPSSRMHSSNRHTQQLTECPHWFSDLWSEGYYDSGRGQVETTRTVSTGKLVPYSAKAVPYSWSDCTD